ncbi:MAG: hypothetical protein ACI9R3_001289 [Verrucomicrobiales bacterium]
MTLALFPPKNLPGASDFESLSYGFLCFGFSGSSCHNWPDDSGEMGDGNLVFERFFPFSMDCKKTFNQNPVSC